MSFEQTDQFVHHVFPVAVGQRRPDGIHLVRYQGTAFLVGNRGFAVTAAHVLPDAIADDEILLGIFNDNGEWRWFEVEASEPHPMEDVAVLKLQGDRWSTFWVIDPSKHFASASYACWGYPDDVAREIVKAGSVALRPDLVYTAGHIRRRISNVEIPMVRGTKLFELSGVAGSGCSGAPIIIQNNRAHGMVIGVYIGQRVSIDSGAFVGYATRIESLADWEPKILGNSLLTESHRTSSDPSPRPWNIGGALL